MQMFIHKKKSDESFGILALYVTCRCAAYSEQKRNRRRSRACRMGIPKGGGTALKAQFLPVDIQKDRILLFFG